MHLNFIGFRDKKRRSLDGERVAKLRGDGIILHNPHNLYEFHFIFSHTQKALCRASQHKSSFFTTLHAGIFRVFAISPNLIQNSQTVVNGGENSTKLCSENKYRSRSFVQRKLINFSCGQIEILAEGAIIRAWSHVALEIRSKF
jgi:hypothetical protein